MDKEQVSCPVCEKKFASSLIEKHVNRCLFLSESSATEDMKRASSSGINSPSAKKIKQELDDIEVVEKQSKNKNQAKNGQKSGAQVVKNSVPLAEKVRPTNFSEFVGQEHIMGSGKILRSLLEKQEVPSMILWGPPGCGKTTLAGIIAKSCRTNSQNIRFVKLSATMSGVNDIKEAVTAAKNEQKFQKKTILFMDEIHRFNKLQQDIFLPHVESGVLTLIGATTENPSFSLNSALLSRCRVIVLEKLKTEDIIKILTRALLNYDAMCVDPQSIDIQSNQTAKTIIETAAVTWLAEMCDGDARIALNTLQLAFQSQETNDDQANLITLGDIKENLKKSHLLYDKKGDQHYDMISAVHKSIRASDDNATLYWVNRILLGGEDPLYVARRLVRAASEDIGLADPSALALAVSTMQGCQLIGMPECDVLLCQCAVYLARAPKSREIENAKSKCKEIINNCKGPQPSVPLHLRNAPTKLMRQLGYGKGYNMRQKEESNLTYMPEGLENMNFFC